MRQRGGEGGTQIEKGRETEREGRGRERDITTVITYLMAFSEREMESAREKDVFYLGVDLITHRSIR